MAQACPKCSAALEHDFGVFVCPQCGSVLFVDFDGQVQMSSSDEVSTSGETAPPLDIPSEPSIHGPPAGLQFGESSSSVSAIGGEPAAALPEIPSEVPSPPSDFMGLELADSGTVGNITENATENDLSYLGDSPSADSVNSVTEPPAAAWDPTEGINMEPGEPASPSRQAPEGPVRFDDVVEYANTAELDSSPLVYTLWIEGIDTQEIRQKVVSVLSETKLNLNVKELLPRIRGGVLEIRDLNPVKTSVIASQLREESVQFRWKQAAFQSEGGAT